VVLIRSATRSFWAWYERNYTLNVSIAAVLFTLQIVHLVWLTGQPLWSKITGSPLFEIDKPWSWPLLLVDYTEIPALISVSFVYLNELRKDGFKTKPVLYLLFLNSQWLHIFWITDSFVVATNSANPATSLPTWLAYVAILIDYLELPVIFDTFKKMRVAVAEERLGEFLREDLA
jgi:hypothetical protein